MHRRNVKNTSSTSKVTKKKIENKNILQKKNLNLLNSSSSDNLPDKIIKTTNNLLKSLSNNLTPKVSTKNCDSKKLAVQDEVLSTNCSELKKIMNKTRELFDRNNDFYHKTDQILQSTSTSTQSPRKTRSRTLKNLSTNFDSSFNLSSVGVPVFCSTFANCELHETCNAPSSSSAPVTPKISKPSVCNIENCNYLINKQNSVEINTIIDQRDMELTPVQGNFILTDKLSNLPDPNRFSMDVNTSLDNINLKSPKGKDKLNGKGQMAVIQEEETPEKSKNVSKLINNKENESDAVEGTPEFTQRSYLLRRNVEVPVQVEKTVDLDVTQDNQIINEKGTVIIGETSEDSDSDVVLKTAKNVSIGKRRLFTQTNSPVALSSPLSSGLTPMISPQRKKWVKRRRVRKCLTQITTRSQSNSRSSLRDKRSSLSQPNLIEENLNDEDDEVNKEDGKNIKDRRKNINDNRRNKDDEVNKIVKKKRIIKSKKIVNTKRNKRNLLSIVSQKISQAAEQSDSTNSEIFMKDKGLVKKTRIYNKFIIVATGFCNGDKDIIREAVKKIEGARLESTVTKKTTHVVTTGVRTINLLRGIIRGCWLITFEWITKSIEAAKWVPPDKYEIQHFSKVLKENRRDREIFGSSYVPELFTTCGAIHIQNKTTPPRDILKELVKTAGGYTIEEPKKAKIIVGPNGLKELWVLDSITAGELQPTDQYKR